MFLFVCTDLVPSPVDKTQSRRQSGLVCSLLVVSLLLSAVVGGEGELSGSTVRTPNETFTLYELNTHWCFIVDTCTYSPYISIYHLELRDCPIKLKPL